MKVSAQSLRNNNDVSCFQRHILTEVSPLDDFGVIEFVEGALFATVANDNRLLLFRKVLKPPRQRQSLEYVNWLFGGDHARFVDFARNVDSIALNGLDDHRDVRRIDVFLEGP